MGDVTDCLDSRHLAPIDAPFTSLSVLGATLPVTREHEYLPSSSRIEGPHGKSLFLPKDSVFYRLVCAYVVYAQHYVSVG